MVNKVQYLSYFIDQDTPVYGGTSNAINIEELKSINIGDTCNDHKISMPLHAGTHIDFPFHFHPDGKKSHEYPASFWIFNKVGFLNCNVDSIVSQIQDLPSDIEILIIKTGFSIYRNTVKYWSEQPVLKSELADIIKLKFPDLKVFGFDLISLTSKLDRLEGKNAHLNFLIKNNILILEDMNLSNLNVTPKQIVISPLQIKNVDGVPCTVLAFI